MKKKKREKNQKRTPAFKVGDLVRTCSGAELQAAFASGDLLDRALLVRELERYTDRVFRVSRIVNTVFDEHSRILHKTSEPLYLLNGSLCLGNVDDFPKPCDRACLLFWRESWLKPVAGNWISLSGDKPSYSLPAKCQWISSEEARLKNSLPNRLWQKRIGLIWDLKHSVKKWIYGVSRLIKESPSKPGNGVESFQVGDWVEVKAFEEIKATLDADGGVNGCIFTREMRSFCGQPFRITRILDHFYDDSRRRFVKVRNLVLLDNVFCSGRRKVFLHPCDRSCAYFWHPLWLKKLSGPNDSM